MNRGRPAWQLNVVGRRHSHTRPIHLLIPREPWLHGLGRRRKMVALIREMPEPEVNHLTEHVGAELLAKLRHGVFVVLIFGASTRSTANWTRPLGIGAAERSRMCMEPPFIDGNRVLAEGWRDGG